MAHGHKTSSGWALMAVVLGIETLGLAWLAWGSLMSVISDGSNPLLGEYRGTVIAQGVGIVIIVLVCAIWALVTTVGAFRRRTWARASNLTIQVLVIAAATGVLQGIIGTRGLGVALLALGVAGLLGAWLTRPRRADDSQGAGAVPADPL